MENHGLIPGMLLALFRPKAGDLSNLLTRETTMAARVGRLHRALTVAHVPWNKGSSLALSVEKFAATKPIYQQQLCLVTGLLEDFQAIFHIALRPMPPAAQSSLFGDLRSLALSHVVRQSVTHDNLHGILTDHEPVHDMSCEQWIH